MTTRRFTPHSLLLALGLAMTGCDATNLSLVARDLLTSAQASRAQLPAMTAEGSSVERQGRAGLPGMAGQGQGQGQGQGPVSGGFEQGGRPRVEGAFGLRGGTVKDEERDPDCEPRCYPGAEQDYLREQEAVRQHPLTEASDLVGRWNCASGLGYLEVGHDAAGRLVGRIIVENGEHAGPIAFFEQVELRDGIVVMLGAEGRLAGHAGRISAGARPEILATFGESSGDGGRPVRFTRS